MKAKLLYLCKFDPFCTFGGAAIRNKAILHLLSKTFEVHIVCFSSSNQELFDVDNRVYSLKHAPNLVTSLLREQSFSVAHFYSNRMVTVIQRLIKDHVFAVIYVSELAMFQYVNHCTHSQQPKLVLDCHNVESVLLREAIPYQSLWQKLLFYLESHALMRFERKAMRRSDSVVFVSEADRRLAGIHYACDHKAFVIPNCLGATVPTGDTEGRDPSELSRFAIVGTLDWHANRTGIAWFIDKIWKPYISHNPTAELYLIGKKYKRRNDFTGRGILHFYNVEDVGRILQSVDICVAPLLYGGGSRLKILEYFVYRKPVIATSKAAHGLDIIPGIHYLKANNYLEFQEATKALLDIRLRSRLVQSGLDLVQSKYDIDSYAETLLSAL